MRVLLLPLLMALQPAPPPPADRVAAALALWQSHPLSATMRQKVIDREIGSAASVAISQAKIKAKDHRNYYDPLRQQLREHLPADTHAIEEQALGCLVEDLAWHLSADDLKATRSFVSTPAGQHFWDEEVLTWERLGKCYRTPVIVALSPYFDIELGKLGLKRLLPDPRTPPPVN